MSIARFSSKRAFAIWKYSVSHGQLLLRSNPSEELSTRVEVMFKNTQFISISAMMYCLEIEELSSQEDQMPLQLCRTDQPWFRLISNNATGYVSAGAFAVSEDNLDLLAPSRLLRPPFI